MSDYPTASTSALIDVLQHRASSPFALSLGLGFAGASAFLFSNVDTLLWSPTALVGSAKERKKVGLEGNQGTAVELWAWYMSKAVVSRNVRSIVINVHTDHSILLTYSPRPESRSPSEHSDSPLLDS
jgi:hypothetical protein